MTVNARDRAWPAIRMHLLDVLPRGLGLGRARCGCGLGLMRRLLGC